MGEMLNVYRAPRLRLPVLLRLLPSNKVVRNSLVLRLATRVLRHTAFLVESLPLRVVGRKLRSSLEFSFL
jgi:hypothetical protein